MIKNFASHLRSLSLAALTLICLLSSAMAATQSIQDVDAPGRKPFQKLTNFGAAAGTGWHQSVVWVPANQRLVIEHVSGICYGLAGYVALDSKAGGTLSGFEYLPGEFSTKYTSAPVEFFANPGELLEVMVSNNGLQSASCSVSVSGYFVDLP